MELSLFLAKILGLYLIIVNLYALIKRKEIVSTLQAINRDPGSLLLIAIITLVFGLLLVVSHNVWVLDWRLIITLIAWLILSGGLFRLFFQDAFIRSNQWVANHKNFLMIFTGVFLLLGLVLSYYGFFG